MSSLENTIGKHNIYMSDILATVKDYKGLKVPREVLKERIKLKYGNHYDSISFIFATQELVDKALIRQIEQEKELYYV